MKTRNIHKQLGFFAIAFLLLAFFSSCSNNEIVDACLEGHTYRFWGGLWHGIIAPIDFVLMLFRDDITVYAQNNNGAWYAFGFLIGSGGWGILGGKTLGKKRKRDNDY
ncbi:MAG: hypothetical protein A2X13_00660 [Bacteroidetes bacterium GWC2_33_15]|nr:MAG: hypothetical protein A2X10_04470 [Bacteroidetes bacterium GWA2_33_15]OFX51130.1 MAG: hypothetical protein A2X13_00660 [Bacteroidetes bacterium GWC2_33_15]OFX66437.1 MAG: hypothetical protein A2X15_07295 [Bacteroidetes bacterium GWB2_32_14]OFX70338.1 MAG: hypothetical protein A2X14_03550 [Bacteroidetes bacterium GWD2_33_33]HAN17341.1 hypothetical protein [Bacteroidales bacterium]